MSRILAAAAAHAIRYLGTLPSRPVAATASIAELRQRLRKPLPENGMDGEAVIDELVRDSEGGIMGSASGRFFGWVIGGTLPAALAADWLTSTWDQNAASNLTAPAEAVVEEVCGEWLKDLLGIPRSASFAFVTGCQMAHTTALAAARHRLLRDRGWNVEKSGLAGAPRLTVLATESRHESMMRSVRLLGIGTEAIRYVPIDARGRMEIGGLEEALRRAGAGPTIVWLQAGDLNTGIFDPFEQACRLARAAKAWVHIDGAFGLWAAASPRYRHLLHGAEAADSWATDGHKWLNLPFDCGLAFAAHPLAHRAAFAQDTSYSIPREELRNQKDWNPEWSRRGRGFPAYTAIRALGRSGIAAIVERCCAQADRLVKGIGALPGAEIIAAPTINQGLVRFLSKDGDHDRTTDAVIRRIQAKGVAWFGGATWRGMRVMRVSVCNWQTTDHDIDATLASIAEILAPAAPGAAAD
ncbi:MAG TPA: aminotransferase class V-fold PLP-dependent enzyme [Stellaceae bacterium]|nr:aminotransferase class V-fold PLP-dependent enzyme [Stellaceae bacterium]